MECVRTEWREGTVVEFCALVDGDDPEPICMTEPDSIDWWNLYQRRWYLTCQGRTCELSDLQNCLLQLLARFQGRPVEYLNIAVECWGNMCASGELIRQTKLRLVETLEKAGMGDLAAAIVTHKGERMSLELSGSPRLFFRCEGVRFEDLSPMALESLRRAEEAEKEKWDKVFADPDSKEALKYYDALI